MDDPEKRASARPQLSPRGEAAEAAFEEYYLAVGKVARAWNTLHEYLGQLFVTVSGSDKVWTEPTAIKVALAIWYSVKSDRAQRDMLRAAVNANSGRWDKLPKALDDLKWLRDRADELADHRNDAVHAPCSIYILDWGAEMGPAYFAAANPRVKNLNAKNLKGKQLIAEFDWCEKYAWTLIGFLQKLEKPIALPDRGLIGPKAAAQGKAVTSAGHSLMAPPAAKTSVGSRSRSGCAGFTPIDDVGIVRRGPEWRRSAMCPRTTD